MSIHKTRLPIHIKQLWLIIVGLVVLAGCTFTDTFSLAPEHETFALYGSQTIGQTFVCHHAGLASIDVLLQAQPGSDDIILHLLENESSSVDIATVTLALRPENVPSFHRFEFPIQDDVNGTSFFIWIESPDTSPENAIRIPYSLAGSPDQVLYLNQAQASGKLSMQLNYNSLYIIKDLGRQAVASGIRTLWQLLVSALLYLIPGGAVVIWFLSRGSRIERLIMAMGLSVAMNALLMYATITGLRLNRIGIIIYLALGTALIILKWILSRYRTKPTILAFRKNVLTKLSPKTSKIVLGNVWASIKKQSAPLTLLAVFALILGVRLFIVRGLAAPMWGDSYQHTMVARLMVEHGGLFDSWEPFAPIATFTYHFGFQANAAIFSWLSGDNMLHSVIWIGQILNTLAVMGLYPLAARASGGNRWAGIGTVLVAGLLSPMPMFYVNWGRYTQLAGQVILPVAMWLTCQITEESTWNWQHIALLVLSLTGLGITHYRVVLIYGTFVVAWGIVFLVREWRQWKRIGHAVLRLIVAGGFVLLLFIPWGMRTFQAQIPTIGQHLIQQGNQSKFHRQEYNAIAQVILYVPWGLLLAGVGAFSWQALKRQYSGWLMGIWTIGLFILSNPYLIGLPGTGIINNFAILIMLYIPVSLIIGIGFGLIVTWMRQWPRRTTSGLVILTIIVVLCAGWGVWQRLNSLDVYYTLLTPADMKAMTWIRENTLPDAKFLVNGFLAYGDTSVVGADGGWWIALLTGRESTIPPLLYSMEAPIAPDYIAQVKSDFETIQHITPTSTQGVQFLRDRQITHIYIGQRKGLVGNPGKALLDVNALRNTPAYRLVYNQNEVWIFEILSELGG